MGGPFASVLLIGDELLAGEVQDGNGPYFADKLTAQGFQVQGDHHLQLRIFQR